MAAGHSGVTIARQTNYTVVQISRLRRRFAEQGLAGLADRPGRAARRASLPASGRKWWR